jgi:hypothetical protein
MKEIIMSITNVDKFGAMSEAEKQAAIAVALPKLEAMVKADQDQHLIPAQAASSKLLSGKVQAPISFSSYGREMGLDFLKAFGVATQTWQTGIVYLLTTAKDKDRASAMASAKAIANGKGVDEVARQSLLKRISEANRVFKASMLDHAKTVAVMKGKGSWHAKVAKLPKGKAGSKGKEKPVATIESALASVASVSPVVNANPLAAIPEANGSLAKGVAKSAPIDNGELSGIIARLSHAQCVLAIDWIAFKLSKSDDVKHKDLGKTIIEFRDLQEEVGKAKAVA